MIDETYTISWYENCSQLDIECGNYEENMESFDNYKEAVRFFDKIQSIGKYNVYFSKHTDELLDESIVTTHDNTDEENHKKAYVAMEFEIKIKEYDDIDSYIKQIILPKLPEELKYTNEYGWNQIPIFSEFYMDLCSNK